jgi:hypothetical protein
MQKTSRTSTPRPRRRFVWGSVIAASAALLSFAACDSQSTEPPGNVAGLAGRGTTASGGSGGRLGSGGAGGSGGSSGSSVAAAGGAPATGGGTGSGGATTGSGGMSTGGTDVTSGGMNGSGAVAGSAGVSNAATGGGGSGGVGIGGMSMGGTGGIAKPCEDTPPPPDPEWPDATCESWALETSECTMDWFKGYCDISCGRCKPEGGGTGGQAAVDCSGEGLPNVTGGDGYATRYWDCCQTHCSQFDNHRCGQDGVSSTGNTQSACSGGGSFACYDQSPHQVSTCLSYGYIAKSNPNCGGCYRIQFTGEGQYSASDPGSRALKGKQMIVKVSNTGGDVAGNQFDLMVPGGGVGQFNACSNQWGTSDLGAQYGGFLSECSGTHQAKKDCVRQECMKIPAGKARDGCIWFVDWFQVADNPKFTSTSTSCPF